MEETIQKKAEQLTADVTAAKAEATAAKAEVAQLKSENTELKNNIDNLDRSVKDQQKTIEALTVAVKASRNVDFKTAFREAFYGQKEQIMKLVAEKADRFEVKLELKDITSVGTNHIVPNNFYGVAQDTNIVAAPAAANAFVVTFGYRPRTGNKLGWLEGSSQSGAGYVEELALNNNKSDVSVVEKTRKFGKIATFMQISTEVEDWFEQLYNYCLNEGVRIIEAKVDEEVLNGNGDDTTHPTHVYGLKGQSTAFAAIAAGAVSAATIVDVIMDAADQVAKAGYQANVCFISWPLYRQLKSVKSSSGEYMFQNGLLNGIAVKPTVRLAAAELIVADSSCAELYAGNSYELELIRNGAYDAYDVYFRKAVQLKVATPKKAGIIYVANAATAVAALLAS